MVNGMLRTKTTITHQLQLEHLRGKLLQEGHLHNHINEAENTIYAIYGGAKYNQLRHFDQNNLPMQSVQQHLTNDEHSFTAREIISETVLFLLFFLFWPFYLICDLVQYVKETHSQTDNLPVKVNEENRTLQNITTLVQGKQTTSIETMKTGTSQYLERLLNPTEELIFKAIENDQQLCERHLVNNGANVHYENILHMTPLMHAIFHNKINMVRLLLNHDPSQIRQRDSLYQRLPLEFCTESKEVLNVDMIRTLVMYSADINEAPDLLLTAAHSSEQHSEEFVTFYSVTQIRKC